MNVSRVYRKFLGGAGLDRLLTKSGQEFQNDIFIMFNRLFHIVEFNIFVWFVAELWFARAKD